MKHHTDYSKKYNAEDQIEDFVEETEIEIQEEPITEPISTPETKFVYVSVARLNLRPNPSIEGDPVKELAKGDELMVMDEEDSWYHVMTASGSEGYVMKEYVE